MALLGSWSAGNRRRFFRKFLQVSELGVARSLPKQSAAAQLGLIGTGSTAAGAELAAQSEAQLFYFLLSILFQTFKLFISPIHIITSGEYPEDIKMYGIALIQ